MTDTRKPEIAVLDQELEATPAKANESIIEEKEEDVARANSPMLEHQEEEDPNSDDGEEIIRLPDGEPE